MKTTRRIFRSLDEEMAFVNEIQWLKKELTETISDEERFLIRQDIKELETQWENAWRVYQGGKAA